MTGLAKLIPESAMKKPPSSCVVVVAGIASVPFFLDSFLHFVDVKGEPIPLPAITAVSSAPSSGDVLMVWNTFTEELLRVERPLPPFPTRTT